MRKFLSLFLSILFILFVSCGQQTVEESKIQVIKNRQPLAVQKIEIPSMLESYRFVHLKSFDGQNAVFTIDREETVGDSVFASETAKIAVYDVLSESIVHVVALDMPGYRVSDAVKTGDNLYFIAWNALTLMEGLYFNNGLENQLIKEFSIATSADYSCFQILNNEIILIRNNGTFDNYDYEFFKVDENGVESIGNFKQQNSGVASVLEYDGADFTVYEIDTSEEEYINFNLWKGDNKERIFRIADEHGHSLELLQDVFVHPIDSIDNNGQYKMMAVADLKTKNVTEIGMIQGGFLGSYKNKGLMYTYGQSDEQILIFEYEDGNLYITPLDIDVSGKNSQSYYMTENNALIKAGTVFETDFELYLLKY